MAIHSRVLQFDDEGIEKLNRLMKLLQVTDEGELIAYLIEDQLYQIEGANTVKAETLTMDVGKALDSILDPNIGIGEVKLSKVEIDQVPLFEGALFDELMKKSPDDKVLKDYRDSEVGRRACELVYARMDPSQWGSEAARKLVERTIQLIDKDPNSGHN